MRAVTVGLALSGGTARSVAHAGVIRALKEHGIGIDYLSGTSGGSIVAVLWAGGKSTDELIDIARGMKWRRLAGLILPRMGLLSSEKIRDFLVEELGDIDFSDLRIPTAVVATDLTAGTKVIFREGSVALACRASSSIPEIYSPVKIDGHYLVDGGLVEYLPVEALAGFGEMFKIAVNLGAGHGGQHEPRNILEVVMRVTGFVAQQNAAGSESLADFVIRPDVERFSPFDLGRAGELIEEGYREAVRRMPELSLALRRYASPGRRLVRRLERRLPLFRRAQRPPG